MTDVIREFETLVAQHPTAAFHAVPHDMAVALLAVLTVPVTIEVVTKMDGREIAREGMLALRCNALEAKP